MFSSSDRLLPGEKILYQASTSKVAWVNSILVFAALFHVGGLLSLGGTSVMLTNQRLLGRAGMFGRKSINLRHAEIEMVGVRRGLLGKMLGYGNVVVTGKNGDRIVFKAISNPLVLQQEVDEAVEVAVLGHKLADLDQPFLPVTDPDPRPVREPRLVMPAVPSVPKPAFIEKGESTKRPRVDPDQW